jgi:hypothetical protein
MCVTAHAHIHTAVGPHEPVCSVPSMLFLLPGVVAPAATEQRYRVPLPAGDRSVAAGQQQGAGLGQAGASTVTWPCSSCCSCCCSCLSARNLQVSVAVLRCQGMHSCLDLQLFQSCLAFMHTVRLCGVYQDLPTGVASSCWQVCLCPAVLSKAAQPAASAAHNCSKKSTDCLCTWEDACCLLHVCRQRRRTSRMQAQHHWLPHSAPKRLSELQSQQAARVKDVLASMPCR